MPTPPPIDMMGPSSPFRDPVGDMSGIFALFFVIALGAWLIPKLINLSKPELTRRARVVGKRLSVSSSPNMATENKFDSTTTTRYYVTFQFEGGEREEFWVGGREYGLMAEGDEGTLVSQGTEIRSFDRLG